MSPSVTLQKTEMGTDKVLMPGEESQKEAGLVSVQWGLGRRGRNLGAGLLQRVSMLHVRFVPAYRDGSQREDRQ